MYVCAVAARAGLTLEVVKNSVVPRTMASSATTTRSKTTGLVNRCIRIPFCRCLHSLYLQSMPRKQKYDHNQSSSNHRNAVSPPFQYSRDRWTISTKNRHTTSES